MKSVWIVCVLFVAACGAKQESTPSDVDETGIATVGDECGGVANTRCNEGSFCRLHDPSSLDRSGTCAERPAACPDIAMQEMPCGADGKRYATSCHANMMGVAIVPGVECETPQSDG